MLAICEHPVRIYFVLMCMCLHCSYEESNCNYVLPAAVSCGPAPNAPSNGQQSGSGTTFGSTVTFTCNQGYNLQGDSRRTCMADGQWNGSAPTCSRKLLRNQMFHYR